MARWRCTATVSTVRSFFAAWCLLACLCLNPSCGKGEAPVMASKQEPATRAPLPPPIRWRMSRALCGEAVSVVEAERTFRPPRGWTKRVGALEWMEPGDTARARGSVRTVAGHGGTVGSIGASAEDYVKILVQEYASLEGGDFALERFERIFLGPADAKPNPGASSSEGAPVFLATYSRGTVGDLQFRSLEVFVDGPAQTTIVTFTVRQDRFDELLPVFQSSAASLLEAHTPESAGPDE